MRGFFGGNIELDKTEMSFAEFSFGRNSNDQFVEDKIFTETDDFILGLDGVILNKKEIAHDTQDWVNYFIQQDLNLAQKLKRIKGVFHGFILNKKTKELSLFNDITGNKNFSYYLKNGSFVFSYDEINLIQLLKSHQLEMTLSPLSTYTFLAYSYLGSTQSWLEEGKRLAPGSILNFINGKISIESYKTFVSEPNNNSSYDKVLSDFEELMQEAVTLQYQKDKDNHKQHFTTLSGGLDSRATTLLAHDLGFKKQTAFTCSQSGYADQIIAEEIAKAYNFEHHFYALDSFEHLFDIENINKEIGGSALYSGPAHVIFGIDKFWNKDYGIIHSGHIGDGVMGAFLSSSQMSPPDLSYDRIKAEILAHHPDFDEQIIKDYNNEEEYKLYERAFCGAACGVWGLEQFSYNIAPFIDRDILDFLLALPYEFKYKRKIYIDWMLKFHPSWTQFKLESIHSKPNAHWKFKYELEYMRIRFGWRKLLSKEFRLKFNMAPEQYWFESSKALQNYYTKEVKETLEIASDLKLSFHKEMSEFSKSQDYTTRAKASHLAYIINLIYTNK